MAYSFTVTPTPQLSQKLPELKKALGLPERVNPHHLQECIERELVVTATPQWGATRLTFELTSEVKLAHHYGLEALERRLRATLLRFADAGSYRVTVGSEVMELSVL